MRNIRLNTGNEVMEVYLRGKKTSNKYIIAIAYVIASVFLLIGMIIMIGIFCLMPIIIPIDFILKIFTKGKIWLIEYQ